MLQEGVDGRQDVFGLLVKLAGVLFHLGLADDFSCRSGRRSLLRWRFLGLLFGDALRASFLFFLFRTHFLFEEEDRDEPRTAFLLLLGREELAEDAESVTRGEIEPNFSEELLKLWLSHCLLFYFGDDGLSHFILFHVLSELVFHAVQLLFIINLLSCRLASL